LSLIGYVGNLMAGGSAVTWETPSLHRPRRRLALPPVCPVLTPVATALGSGSRFGVLDGGLDEDGEVSLAEEVAWRGLDDVSRVLPLGQMEDRPDGRAA
jgi:hypothetical protein